MIETLKYFRSQVIEAIDVAKIQWKSFLVAVLLMVSFYTMSIYIPPGWVTYMFIFPAAGIVAITSLARVNDIGPERMGKRWQVRKIALILAGAGSVMLLATPFLVNPAYPTWRAVIIMWGFAGTWLTTPEMPPWDYYITGKYRFLTHPPDKVKSPLYRVAGKITGQLKVDELMRRQAEYEREQKKRAKNQNRRKGDGEGP